MIRTLWANIRWIRWLFWGFVIFQVGWLVIGWCVMIYLAVTG